MRRKITVIVIIIVCFLLQNTIFKSLAIASVSPNLLIVVTSSFGFMRGKKEGMAVGFICGFLIDIFFGGIIGFYALLYMYIGFLNGFFRKSFFPEEVRLPMLLIGASDFGLNLVIYFFQFFFPEQDGFRILCRTADGSGTDLYDHCYVNIVLYPSENKWTFGRD